MELVFSTSDLPASERVSALAEAVRRNFIPLHLAPIGDARTCSPTSQAVMTTSSGYMCAGSRG